MITSLNLSSGILVFLLSTLFSCTKVKDLIDPKTDVEKLHEYVNSSEWSIDSIRSQTSDANRTTIVENYKPYTSGKVTFSKVTKGHGYTKGTMTSVVNVNGTDSTIHASFLIADVKYIKLYYPNPNIGLTDVEIIYDIKESSNSKFTFIRDELLVNPTNGATYGYARTVFKLKK